MVEENPIATLAHVLGLPAVEDIIPSPEEMAKTIGIPTPGDLAKQMKSKTPIKLPGMR